MTERHAGPGVMPVDRERWKRELNLSNFVNAYYQYRDLQRFPGCRRVLIIGPGQGLQTAVLKWRGFEVVTLDVDKAFSPDVCGSVHDMHMFDSRAFDAAIASHVLPLPGSYPARVQGDRSDTHSRSLQLFSRPERRGAATLRSAALLGSRHAGLSPR
jgi:hypothetical protein